MKKAFLLGLFLASIASMFLIFFALYESFKLSELPIVPQELVAEPTAAPLQADISMENDSAKDPQIKLIAVGDIMLARSVNTSMIRLTDWRYPFLQTAQVLKQADILFGNLESPFGPDCPYTDEGMQFCADPLSLEGLVFAGFDVLSLANNHGFDQGREGHAFTKNLVSSAGILPVGFSETAQTVVSNAEGESVKVGFAAFDDTLSSLELDQVQKSITDLSSNVDVVIASFHWGIEYRDQPSQRQRELAQVATQAGARLILGHHPHWVQTVEEIILPSTSSSASERTVVFYSLGNFVFDQMWSKETRTGQVAFITLDKSGVVSYEASLVEIFDYSQPRFIEVLEGN